MGACHGKGAGQNGFRLSLRGYAPELDHQWLTREFANRRVSNTSPQDSLLLRKALGLVPHGGGRVIADNSAAHQLLTRWIEAGSPGIDAQEPQVEGITVSVAKTQLAPGEQQPIKVTARLSNQETRDITWLCKFFSNDDSIIDVRSDGMTKCLRAGETSVRVHFLEFVEIVTLVAPHDQPSSPSTVRPRNNLIDDRVTAKLSELRIPPSSGIDDATFIRRVYLDTLGIAPTAEETAAFIHDTNKDKRRILIDQLLERTEYVDFWTLQLADIFQNRKERDHDCRGPKGVRQFHSWLRAQVAENRGWNAIATDVLTATGDSFARPPVGYFIVTVGEQREAERSEIVASVAQSFLGTRIGCAQCHNHPLERYTQDDYYHFAAFFSRVAFQRGAGKEHATQLWPASHERANHLRNKYTIEQRIAQLSQVSDPQDDTSKKELETQQAELQKINQQLLAFQDRPIRIGQPRTGEQLSPRPLDRQPLEIANDADPRTALASWMTSPNNGYFSGSMVNRLWKHFYGVGLVEPVDDLRPSNPPSNKALWDYLNQEFVSSNYNIKHVIRLIVNSQTYQTSSSTVAGNINDRKYYSHYYARRLPAEVLLDAISTVSGVPDEFPGYPLGMRATQIPDPGTSSYFLSLFGRSERVTACACERTGEVTLPQLLHIQNGDWITRKLGSADGAVALQLKASLPVPEMVKSAYLSVLSRYPTAEELTIVEQLFNTGVSREEILGDLYWTLMNSREFAFNR